MIRSHPQRRTFSKYLFSLLLAVVLSVILGAHSYADPLDIIADQVIGQPNMASNTANNGGVSATSLFHPGAVITDQYGNVYVADSFNHRILEYNSPWTSDWIADRVFGQPNFTTNTANSGGVSDTSLDYPSGLALDLAGNLYVADYDNSRVLVYLAPLTTDTTADYVLGQPNFTTNTLNFGGVSATSLGGAADVAVDRSGNVYVSDGHDSVSRANNRVLVYIDPLHTDAIADYVLGQPDFVNNTPNNGGISASTLNHPMMLCIDEQGNVYVADFFNNRVLEYDTPLETDRIADRVWGQPNFTSSIGNNGGISASSLLHPIGVWVDLWNHLYIADTDNHRVLQFDDVHSGDTIADQVFGQSNFTSNAINVGGVTASSLYRPYDVFVDSNGDLHVADWGNNRALIFDEPLPIPLATATSTVDATATSTPTATATPTLGPTATATSTVDATATSTPTATATPAPTPSSLPTPNQPRTFLPLVQH